jgi:hypothetical protein
MLFVLSHLFKKEKEKEKEKEKKRREEDRNETVAVELIKHVHNYIIWFDFITGVAGICYPPQRRSQNNENLNRRG